MDPGKLEEGRAQETNKNNLNNSLGNSNDDLVKKKKKTDDDSNEDTSSTSGDNNNDGLGPKWRLLWRQLFMEFTCTMLFIFFATGGAVNAGRYGPASYSANIVVALAQGFSLAAFISAAANISGGHLNPAVTVAAFVAGCFEWWRAILYVVAQCAGGFAASGLLLGVLPGQNIIPNNLGSTTPQDVNEFQAFLWEAIMTFGLVFVVLSTAVSPASKKGGVGRFAPLPIGLTLSAALLISWPYTGTSLNPARSLGPAVLSHTYKSYWVYWVGPLTGAIFAGLMYGFFVLPSAQRQATRELIHANNDIYRHRQRGTDKTINPLGTPIN